LPGARDFEPSYNKDTARAALDLLVHRVLGETDAASVVPRAVFDLPAAALLGEAREADLLVVGARGLGRLQGLLLGSVSQRCAHLSPVPLVILRAGTLAKPAARILVGVDGSDASRVALAWAANEARLRGCGLRVVNATRDGSGGLDTLVVRRDAKSVEAAAHQLLDHMIAGAPGADNLDVEVDIVASEPAGVLVEASAAAVMTVVGNHGRSSFGGAVLGSVAQKTALHALGPIVLVPDTTG
jgi:nucleotide-binding universal stress UspA family protein